MKNDIKKKKNYVQNNGYRFHNSIPISNRFLIICEYQSFPRNDRG